MTWVTGGGANMWIVESGLAPGDKIIVEGIAKLMPGAPIKLAGSAPAPATGGAISKSPAPPGGGDAKSAPAEAAPAAKK